MEVVRISFTFSDERLQVRIDDLRYVYQHDGLSGLPDRVAELIETVNKVMRNVESD